MRESLDSWVDNAPSEIRDDTRTAAETMRNFINLLDEFDYDVFAMVAAGDDPRFAAIQSPAFTEATNRIAAYCGIEIEAPALYRGPPLVGVLRSTLPSVTARSRMTSLRS